MDSSGYPLPVLLLISSSFLLVDVNTLNFLALQGEYWHHSYLQMYLTRTSPFALDSTLSVPPNPHGRLYRSSEVPLLTEFSLSYATHDFAESSYKSIYSDSSTGIDYQCSGEDNYEPCLHKVFTQLYPTPAIIPKTKATKTKLQVVDLVNRCGKCSLWTLSFT